MPSKIKKEVDDIQRRYNTHDWDWSHTDALDDPDGRCRKCGMWVSNYPFGCIPECMGNIGFYEI